jgi:AmmeMemoRadiSam system protein B
LNSKIKIVLFIFIIIFFSSYSIPAKKEAAKVRKSTLAGSWYPNEKKVLKEEIENFFKKVPDLDVKGRIFSFVAPHAGYMWSGRCAASVYKILKGRPINRVIILGPSHSASFNGLCSSYYDYYETPLGKVAVDRDICTKLSKNKLFKGPERAEALEHSLEIQLPFLQLVLSDFKIVPLVVGDLSIEDYKETAKILTHFIDEKTLLIASSDFTHYGYGFSYLPFTKNYKENLKKLDIDACNLILKKDFPGFMNYIDQTKITICGFRPIGLMLNMLPEVAYGKLLKYYTSGDLTGDYSNSVSYVSLIFTIP